MQFLIPLWSIPVRKIFTTGTLFLATVFGACFFFCSISSADNPFGRAIEVNSEDESDVFRSIGEYRRDLKKFMKLSKNDDDQLQRNAIFNLCALHYELVADPRFQSSDLIQGFRVVAAKRLNGFTKELKKTKLAEARKLKKQNRSSNAQQNSMDEQNDKAGDESAADGSEGSEEKSEQKSEEESEYEAMYRSAAQTYQDLGQISGGPNQLFNYAGGQFGSPWDHGDELVALIQNTVDPSGWRDAGGNASIHYYRPLRVLVINASQRTHDKTEELLWMLRASQ